MENERKNITLLHAYGQSYFNSEEILGYGSLENIMASEVLVGIPNREKSITELWAAAHVAEDVEAPTESEDAAEQNEETEE